MKNNTTVLKGNNPVRQWHFIDLAGMTLGRACTQIAALLQGKNKVAFSYHRDDGDYVVAINAAKIKVTGKKLTEKMYHHYSGWAGGLKSLTLAEMMAKDPRKVISLGVTGMLPKNNLRDQRITRLKVFVGSDHKYTDKFAKKD